MSPKKGILLLGLLAATVVLAAPAGAQSNEVPVTAKGTRFNNSGDCNAAFVGTVTEVTVGTTVLWRNCDTTISHTVTSDQGKFQTQPLPPGGAARLRFDSPGRFEYFCEIHGRTMQGTVVVKAAQAATTVPPAATTTTPPTTAPPATTTTTSAAPTTTTTSRPATTTTAAPTTTTTTEATSTTTSDETTTTLEDVELDEAAAEDDADEGAEPLLVLAIVVVLAAIAIVGTLVWRSRRSGWR